MDNKIKYIAHFSPDPGLNNIFLSSCYRKIVFMNYVQQSFSWKQKRKLDSIYKIYGIELHQDKDTSQIACIVI
jgi:hypothetical protein